MHSIRWLVGVLILLACLAGPAPAEAADATVPANPTASAEETAGAAASAEPKLPIAARLSPDTPVAVVNGTPVPYWKYLHSARMVLGNLRAGGGHSGVGLETKQIRDEVLGDAVRRQLLFEDAMKAPPPDLDEQADRAVKAALGRFPTPEAFQAALAAESLSEANYRAILREDTAIAHYSSLLTGSVTATEEECRDYYSKMKSRSFQLPERADLSHLLVPRGADEASDAEARSAVAKARARILAGEPFAAVAQEVSRDPLTRDAGGRLGPRSRAELGEVADACFGLKEGEVSEVVESRFGYHLFLSHGTLAPREVSFEEARPEIEGVVRSVKAQRLVTVKVEELAKAAELEILLPHQSRP